MKTKLIMYFDDDACVDIYSEISPQVWKINTTLRSCEFSPLKEYLVTLGFFKNDVEQAYQNYLLKYQQSSVLK